MSAKRKHGKLCRAEALRDERGDTNVVRGHALFVRFMERKGLADCVQYFPEGMTLGQLRGTTPHDLLRRYDIRDKRDRDRIARIMEESHREDHSDPDVVITPSQSAVQAKAKFFLRELRSLQVIQFAHFMVDLFAILVNLSMALQNKASCVYTVHQQIVAVIASLEKLKTRPGPKQREFASSLEASENVYQGEKLQGEEGTIKSEVTKVSTALIRSVENRFSDLDSGLLEATKLADLTCWPPTYTDAADFGDAYLAALVDHYRELLQNHGVDIYMVEPEWTQLKQEMYTSLKPHQMNWVQINSLYRGRFANFLDVVDLILSIPATSAECERGFSQLKVTKTSYRNRLKSSTLTMLMTIQLISDPVTTFDPTPAIHHWNSNHNRRPNFIRRRKLGGKTDQESNNNSQSQCSSESESDIDFGQLGEDDSDSECE